jgi:hypothetical protein
MLAALQVVSFRVMLHAAELWTTSRVILHVPRLTASKTFLLVHPHKMTPFVPLTPPSLSLPAHHL